MKQLSLKNIIIEKIEKLAESKYKQFKTDTLYFENQDSSITHMTYYGINICYKRIGGRVFLNYLDGKEMMSIINQIKKNEFYCYTMIQNTRCKVRPKKIDRK